MWRVVPLFRQFVVTFTQRRQNGPKDDADSRKACLSTFQLNFVGDGLEVHKWFPCLMDLDGICDHSLSCSFISKLRILGSQAAFFPPWLSLAVLGTSSHCSELLATIPFLGLYTTYLACGPQRGAAAPLGFLEAWGGAWRGEGSMVTRAGTARAGIMCSQCPTTAPVQCSAQWRP